ncbi:alpha/beta family hydrolase [Salinispirillum marinum]|uniref:Alpha/beta family hydrolase n=2 Tax=Saccharospirillaceae TaxID=255527 RepID=A0ABV8BF74_9GAMM
MSRYLRNTCANPQARILLLHGAGAPMDSLWMNTVAEALSSLQLDVVRWEFQYMHQRRVNGKKRPPSKAPVLLAELAETISELQTWDQMPLFLAGKSMGGRMATMLIAQQPELNIHACLAFGYPFHPPGKPERLRTEHFSALKAPVYILQGSADTMGNQTLVSGLRLPDNMHIRWVESGNHDLRAKGLKQAEVMPTLAAEVTAFVNVMLGR